MRAIFLIPLFFFSFLARAEDEGASAQKEVTIEEFLQSLSTVQGVVMRKDPFQEVGPPFELPVASPTGEVDDSNQPVYGAPVLERWPITDYEVVAVLLGDQYPRALLRLPKEPGATVQKVVIVKENDKLGNRKGVIARITLEGVIVQQAQRSKHGFVDKTEVLLKVGGVASDQKRALVAAKQASTEKEPSQPQKKQEK
jgi:hypothetical protein